MLRAAVAAIAVLVLAACGGGDSSGDWKDDDDVDVSLPGMSKYAKVVDATDAIREADFVQDDTYVNMVAIVDNPRDDPEYGQEIDVAFDLLDADGTVIDSDTAYGAFGWAGQRTAFMAQVKTSQRVARVRATAKLRVNSDPGSHPMKPVRGRIDADGYGDLTVVNPGRRALKAFELVVVCRDAKGRISGVGSEFVDGVPAGGEQRVSVPVVGGGRACLGYPSR